MSSTDVCQSVEYTCRFSQTLWTCYYVLWISKIMIFFPRGSDSKESACNVRDPVSIPRLERSPGEGNGYPLQYSCLENSIDRGTWWAAAHGVAESRTQLRRKLAFPHSLGNLLLIFIVSLCIHQREYPLTHQQTFNIRILCDFWQFLKLTTLVKKIESLLLIVSFLVFPASHSDDLNY